MSARARAAVLGAACLVAAGSAVRAGGVPSEPTDTLILALDGIPYHLVAEAHANGAFPGWPAPRPLVTPFPSMSNVGFVAILSPLGSEPMQGYELRHFDPQRNQLTGGGPFGYRRQAGAWRRWFFGGQDSLLGQAGHYFRPGRNALHEMDEAAKVVLREPQELRLALVSASDPLMHFQGDTGGLRFLLELGPRIEELRRRYAETHGRPLRVVLLSDHGNGGGKIRAPGGFRQALRAAGLNPASRLVTPNDVALVTYGVCSYGALFVDPATAARAATAMLSVEGVQLAAWISGEGELRVVSPEGGAVVHWRHRAGRRQFAYEHPAADPLALAAAEDALAVAGALDADGFADEDAWFERSAASSYPDAMSRLVDALGGRFVRHPATVLLSLAPGYAWGVAGAQAGAWLRGGRLEATHGGLDRVSSWGFFLRSDAAEEQTGPLRAQRALAEWADAGALRVAGGFVGDADDRLHGLRSGVR